MAYTNFNQSHMTAFCAILPFPRYHFKILTEILGKSHRVQPSQGYLQGRKRGHFNTHENINFASYFLDKIKFG